MTEKPDTARNWKWASRACVLSALLMAGSAGAYDFNAMADPPATQDGYGGGDSYPSNDPDYAGLQLLDPGYAFSVYDVYGYPGSGVRDNAWAGNYGYPGQGMSGYGYPGYGYGPITRSYSLPSNGGTPNSTAASNRAYIRQLEERIRKLEMANQQQPMPAYGERMNTPAWPSVSPAQPAYEAPAAGQFGQQPAYPGAGTVRGGHSEYPTFQPSYGVPPTYQFR